MKRKIAVILASDVAGYSLLVADDEEGTIRLMAAASKLFRDLVARYDGRVFNTAGDAILAEFDSAVNAVRCAIDIQNQMRPVNASLPQQKRVLFRMGVAIGDVVVADNGDLLGDGVNIAARLESLAEPGGVCVSDNVQVLVDNKVTVGFHDIGEHKLKNIPRPVRAFRVTLAHEAAVAASPPERPWWKSVLERKRDAPALQSGGAGRGRGLRQLSAFGASFARGLQAPVRQAAGAKAHDGPWWLLAIGCLLALAVGLAIWPPWRPTAPPTLREGAGTRPAAVSGAATELAVSQRAECMRLAAPTGDAAGGGPGVDVEPIDALRAVPVCRSALAAWPEDAEVQTWTARALAKAGDLQAARALFERAAERGNAIAMSSLGQMLQSGRGAAQDHAAARRWYEMAADKGHAYAMRQLGTLYEQGIGVAQDLVKARTWYQRAAEMGRSDAMHMLGWLAENGKGGAQDLMLARSWYQKAAEKGNTASQNNLGTLYETGRGVPQNFTAAHRWYEKAAAGGSADAMQNLGALYISGRGVVQDYALARSWLESAAEKGNALAMGRLGSLYEHGRGVPQDLAAARNWYEKAAAGGDKDAMYNLGTLYANGRGVAQNHTLARSWLEKAAEKGHAFAMGQLGTLYERGRGVQQNFDTARSWYEKAAARDDPAAMSNLGVLYAKGLGVAQNFGTARSWFEKAAEKGNVNAMLNLGVLYANGQGVAQDFALARSWSEKAAATGHTGAMHNLGWLYQSAQGGLQDYALARAWYEKAAAKGSAASMNNLGWLYENGRGVARDFAIARNWYEKAAQRGHTDAMVNLASMFDGGRAGSSPADAARHLLAAARNGSERARSLLAGDMAGWGAATRAAIQQQLKASGAYGGSIGAKWDTASRVAAKAYWESGTPKRVERVVDDDLDCRRFVPAAGLTVSVACVE
jgi:TPR repeat protein/class 3 adenylate cyclase